MDALLGLFIAWSAGFGFDPGVGVEAGLTGRYGELVAAATSEEKLGQEHGYSWSATGLLFAPIGDFALGAGWTWYGYDSSWRKHADGPVYAAAYRPGRSEYRLFYIQSREFEDAIGVRADAWITGGLSATVEVLRLMGDDATAMEIGVRWRSR